MLFLRPKGQECLNVQFIFMFMLEMAKPPKTNA